MNFNSEIKLPGGEDLFRLIPMGLLFFSLTSMIISVLYFGSVLLEVNKNIPSAAQGQLLNQAAVETAAQLLEDKTIQFSLQDIGESSPSAQ